jgi:hypothetical protein
MSPENKIESQIRAQVYHEVAEWAQSKKGYTDTPYNAALAMAMVRYQRLAQEEMEKTLSISWTREHDRLIAEKIGNRIVVEKYNEYWIAYSLPLEPISDYFTDLAACFREVETWRKAGDPVKSTDLRCKRKVQIDSPNGMRHPKWSVSCFEGTKLVAFGEGVTPSEAVARALYELAERMPDEQS